MADKNSFKPPQAVQNNVRRGIELRRRFKRGSMPSHAQYVAKGEDASLQMLLRIMEFFDAHDEAPDLTKEGHRDGPSVPQIAWLMHGGDAGRRWASQAVAKAKANESAKTIDVEIKKVDEELGIVFGYAIVCLEKGEQFFDSQGDHITEDAMLEATSSFMSGFRVAKDMHVGGTVGQVVYGFPVTTEIAKALDILVEKTGFIVGMKPDSAQLLEKYAKGQYTGFSIGGKRIEQENVTDG